MADIVSPVPDGQTDSDLAAQERTPEDVAKYWNTQLDLAEKDHRDFKENGKRVLRRYKTERDDTSRSGGRQTKRFNILYSNTEMLLAALYGKMATPDVRRRYTQSDPVGESVSDVVEGALIYCNEVYGDKPIEAAIKDYLLPGRGVVRIEYEPKIVEVNGEPKIVDQVLRERYVFWEDFLCMPARTWADIETSGWVAFRHRMTRTELIANFGEKIGREVPLNWAPEIGDRKHLNEAQKKAEVWEVWDITDRKRTWIVRGFVKSLREDEDPYGLENFFPLPEPISYYTTTDTIIPEPEFFVYKDQADDLDEITQRISRLTKALKRRGVYDQSVKELSRLASAGDNQFIPVENYANLATKGGLQQAFQTEDISVVAEVLLNLYGQRDRLVQQIWELVGMADIMRGQGDAQKTLGAQQLEAQFGSQRMLRRQRNIQRWIRDLLRIKAEIIAEHFEPDILQQITGIQITPEIMQVLRTDKLRSYRIDIETDSTIFEDEQEQQAARGQMIESLTKFIAGWGPIVAAQPIMVPLAFELMKFGMGGFKAIRPIEDAIDQASNVMNERAQANQFQAPPNPEQQKAQVEIQARQMEMQTSQQKAAAELQIQREKAQNEATLAQQKHAHDIDMAQREHAHKVHMDRMEAGRKGLEAAGKAAADGAPPDMMQQLMQGVGQSVAPEIEAIAKAIQQSAVQQQQMMQMLAASQQQTQQVLQSVAQSNSQIAAAIMRSSMPKRRVAVRDETGQITHADEIPISIQ